MKRKTLAMVTRGRPEKPLSALRIIAIAIVVALLAKTFALDLVIVRGESMSPAVASGTVAVVARCAYGLRLPFSGRYIARWSDPRPGDIVLLAPGLTGSRRAVKRVFEVGPAFMKAEAGILIGRGGSAEIGASGAARLSGTSFVPAGRVFVLGDNAALSLDSRDYGAVPIEKIAGKVLLYFGGASRAVSKTELLKDAADDVDR